MVQAGGLEQNLRNQLSGTRDLDASTPSARERSCIHAPLHRWTAEESLGYTNEPPSPQRMLARFAPEGGTGFRSYLVIISVLNVSPISQAKGRPRGDSNATQVQWWSPILEHARR